MPESEPEHVRPDDDTGLDPDSGDAFTARLADAIVEMEAEGGARGPELARRLAASLTRVRAELNQLEALGVVYRTGAKRGTRWWVG